MGNQNKVNKVGFHDYGSLETLQDSLSFFVKFYTRDVRYHVIDNRMWPISNVVFFKFYSYLEWKISYWWQKSQRKLGSCIHLFF